MVSSPHEAMHRILQSQTPCVTSPKTSHTPSPNLIAQGLGKRPAAQLWRHLMAVDLSFFKSPISEEIRDEGRAEGAVERGAEDILLVLEQRGLDVSDEVRARITDCGDPDTLRQWLARAVTAPSAEGIFAEE